MTPLHPLPVPGHPEDQTLLARLARLLKLELELGLAETRQLLTSILVAVAVAVPAAMVGVAAIVVLIASAFAPLFGAAWQHLVIAGGALLALGLASTAWSVWRLRHLTWPTQTRRSFEETWRWLGAQLRSRLTLR